MDTETNLIAAELMAAQGILMCVLRRIAAVDENLASAIKGRFDDAANLAEKMTLALGEAAPSSEAVEAQRTIERLRRRRLANMTRRNSAVGCVTRITVVRACSYGS